MVDFLCKLCFRPMGVVEAMSLARYIHRLSDMQSCESVEPFYTSNLKKYGDIKTN